MAFPVAAVLPILGGVLGGNRTDPAQTDVGRFIGGITGRNRNAAAAAAAAGQSVPAAPIQAKSLASGTVTFGEDQKKTYLGFGLLLVALVFVWRFFSPRKRRRR